MIRAARPDEIAPVCAEIAKLLPWTLLGINGDELVQGLKVDSLRELFVHENDDGGSEISGAIIMRRRAAAELLFHRGFGEAMARQAGLDFPCEWRAVPDAGYIGSLAAFNRRRGIGQRLIDAAHERFAANRHKRVLLMVSHFNHDAKRFYERNGYREIACLDDCLKAGNREHLMERVLSESVA